jgi:hypothetical protein
MPGSLAPRAQPWVLDLCCCSGGATKGYQRVGLYVRGVDIVDRPNYCGDAFQQADALEVLDELATAGELTPYGRPDLIHMSWPCQAGCTLTNGTNKSKGWGRDHPQLVPEGRRLADLTGIPYVIEQPQGHGGLIRTDVRLCMDMFPVEPPRVFRHRDFEVSGFTVPQPVHPKHTGRVRGRNHGVTHEGDYVAAYGSGGGKATVAEMQHALGVDWTDVREELTEAIPPAYTELIGRSFLSGLGWADPVALHTPAKFPGYEVPSFFEAAA